MADPKKQSAYGRTYKHFTQCSDIADSEEDVQDIVDAMNALYVKLMAKKKQQQKPNVNLKNDGYKGARVQDFPALEKKQKVQRKAPFGSPSRKK